MPKQTIISRFFDTKSSKSSTKTRDPRTDANIPYYRAWIERQGEWVRVKRCTLCGQEVQLTPGSSSSMQCYEQHYNSPRCQKAAVKLKHSANADWQGVYLLPEEKGGETVMIRYKQCVICKKHVGLGLGTKLNAYEAHVKGAKCNFPPGARTEMTKENKLSIIFKDGSRLSHPYVLAKPAEESTVSLSREEQVEGGESEGVGSIGTKKRHRKDVDSKPNERGNGEEEGCPTEKRRKMGQDEFA